MTDRSPEGGWFFDAVLACSEDAIICADLTRTITCWNPGAERMLGYTAEEAVGQPIGLIVRPGREQEQADAVARAAEGDIIHNIETSCIAKGGAVVTVAYTMGPIRDAHGHVVGVLAVTRCIDDRYRDNATRRLAAIVESSEDAIISKDLQGTVMTWNVAAERIFGYSSAEMIGRSIRTIVPHDRQFEEDEVLARVARGDRVDHFDTWRRRKDGTLIPISLTVSPIRDGQGVVVGASKVARDITERRLAEGERTRLLAAAEEQAAITAKINEVGGIVASTLDRAAIVQAVTDAATSVTTAEFGAFFYNALDPVSGEEYQLYALSGAPIESFASFPHPRATALFGPTFRGEAPVRLADVTKDPRYGHMAPHHGMPPGHLPVRSYLAVPVKARSGEVLGALFFGHSNPGVFTDQHRRLAEGIAAWGSVALENARLYVGAQEANRLKDEFLATLSHELRTPLNAILGYARMLRSGLIAPGRQEHAVETIERNATSLTQIVEDVLDVSRIVSGKIRLNVQPLDMGRVVHDSVDAVMPAADARGVRVRTVIEPDAPPFSGDPDRLQQVIWNLVSNAVKFTPRDGDVEVRVRGSGGNLEVSVSDTGAGIPHAFLPFIFERFRQADAGTTREQGGLGLGLSIARHLVEMHGGTIVADSPGEGRGSTFRIVLPSAVPRPASAAPGASPGAARRDAMGGVPDLAGVRVLAVDDDADALRLVQEALQAAGADVIIASSAMEALDRLGESNPDVLIADIGMPRMDGFELIRRVREHPDPILRRIPAAALTAYARSDDRQKALASGYQVHLAKPLDPGELMATVAALTRRATTGRRG